MSFQRERCVILRVVHPEHEGVAYVEEDDVEELVQEQGFIVSARAIAFFEPVKNGEN